MMPKRGDPQYQEHRRSSDVSLEEPTSFGYRDVVFGVAFYAHLIGIVYIAVAYKDEVNFEEKDTSSEENNDEEKVDPRVIYASITAAVLSVGFGFVWMNVLKRYSTGIIKFCFVASVSMTCITALFALAVSPGMGIVLLFLAGLQTLYFYLVRRRVAFTSVLLECSIEVLKAYNGSMFIALGVQIVSVAWLVLWSYAATGVSIAVNDNANSENSNVSSGVGFLLLVSLFWTMNVLANTVLVTVSGVAATWYFNTESRSVTSSSLKRALTTSFGSICFGSLVLSVISALKTLVRAQTEDMPAVARCIIMCIVSCLHSIAEFITKYAFVHVGIYGDSFIGAAKKTWQLFMSRGFDVLINDDLTGLALAFSVFVGGAFAALLGGLVAVLMILNMASVTTAMLFSFVLGMAIIAVMMSVLDACVATMMVLWADDPASLRTNHPGLHQKLSDAVHAMYPMIRGI